MGNAELLRAEMLAAFDEGRKWITTDAVLRSGVWPFAAPITGVAHLEASLSKDKESLTATGTVDFGGTWRWFIEADRDAKGETWAHLVMQPVAATSVAEIAERLGLGDVAAVAALALRALRTFQGGEASVALDVSGSLRPRLLGVEVELEVERIRFRPEGAGPLDAKGTISLGEVSVAMTVRFDGGLSVSVDAPQITLGQLVERFGVPFPEIPLVPDEIEPPTWKVAGLTLDFAGERVAATMDLAFASVTAVVAAVEGRRIAAAAVMRKSFFAISSVVPALAPLDRYVEFGSPAVLFASDLIEVAPAGLGWNGRIERGLTLLGRLRFDGIFAVLGKLLGRDGVDVRLPTQGAPRIEAVVEPLIEVGGFLTLKDLAVAVSPVPRADVRARADVVLLGERLPELTIEAALDEAGASISLGVEKWDKPFGLPVDLRRVWFTVRADATFGLAGTIELKQGREIAFDGEFLSGSPPLPVVLEGRITGAADLVGLLREVLNADKVPDLPFVRVTDPTVHAVLLQKEIGGNVYDRGLVIGGDVDILGFGATLHWRSTPEEASGSGRLKQGIDFGPAFAVRGRGRAAPGIRFDSSRSPHLVLDAEVTVLGLTQEVELTVENDGLKGKAGAAVGSLLYGDLSLAVDRGGATADGHAGFGLDCEVPLSAGGVDLGQLSVSVRVDLAVKAVVRADGARKVTLNGAFEVAGVNVRLEDLAIDADSFEAIRPALVRALIDQAPTLFARFLTDPDAWIRAFRDKAIGRVSDLASALIHHLPDPQGVVNELQRAGFRANQVFNALAERRIYGGLQLVSGYLRAANYELQEVADALWFGYRKDPRGLADLLYTGGFKADVQPFVNALGRIRVGGAQVVPVDQLANVLRERLGLGSVLTLLSGNDRFEAPQEVAIAAMIGIGISPETLMGAMRTSETFYHAAADEVARWFKQSGVTAEDTLRALNPYYEVGKVIPALGSAFNLDGGQVGHLYYAVGLPVPAALQEALNRLADVWKGLFG